MKLSFIIPAHNEQAYLAETLGALRAAMRVLESAGRPTAHEVIVAADGCTDGTVQIAQAAGATVVSHERRQIAATRNLGARAATGDVLVFVDADTRVSPDVVTKLLDAIAGGAIGGGASFRLDGPLPLYAKLLMPVLTTAFRLANLTGGAFFFCTRAAFDQCGGWDEAYFAGEELRMAGALKKLGRFRILRATVETSGRKVRTHSPREMLGLFWRGLVRPSMMRDRAQLDFFYGARRLDPLHTRPADGA